METKRVFFRSSRRPQMPHSLSPNYLSMYLSIYLSIHLSIYLSTYLSIKLFLHLSIHLPSFSRPLQTTVTLLEQFHLHMCVSPQCQAIFPQWNVKKCSEDYSFLTFSLPNVLFATVACNFSTSERPKVVQTCGVLYILTFKCAFRHSGVQFFDI